MMTLNEVWDVFSSRIAKYAHTETGIWYNERSDEIMCANESLAEMIADIIDGLCGPGDTHVGYYDPKADELEGIHDECTGWWYVDYD